MISENPMNDQPIYSYVESLEGVDDFDEQIEAEVAMARFAFLCETGMSLEKHQRDISEYDEFAKEAWVAAGAFMKAMDDYYDCALHGETKESTDDN
jgi:hypothetical protein